MQKRSIFIIAIVAVIALMAYPVFAKGPSKPSGESNTGHLYLYEKIPCPDTDADCLWDTGVCNGFLKPWLIAEGGAWGKMKYNLSGETFDFVFNGHGLPVSVSYTLIYYPDNWAFAQLGNVICLGEGTVNGGGNIHIAGSKDTGTDLPMTGDLGDCNYGNAGAKIWLVPSEDVDCDSGKFLDWDAPAYLFEDAVIFFDLLP